MNGFRIARTIRGQTTNQTAAKAKMHRSRLSRIEHDHVVPNEGEVERLSRVLDVEPTWLRQPEVALPRRSADY